MFELLSKIYLIKTKKNLMSYVDQKEILKSISGKFRSCELTAVIGQSGSGKTTLLNVLSGYTKNITSGRVVFGDVESRCDKAKSSKFIMQNYSLQRFITVREAMSFAANLKLHGVSNTCRNYKVREIEINYKLTACNHYRSIQFLMIWGFLKSIIILRGI